jgi:hypothetical protein
VFLTTIWYVRRIVDELLEAKLTIGRIKVQLLDLAGELIADNLSDKEYAIKWLMTIVDYIDENDVVVKEINPTLPESNLI